MGQQTTYHTRPLTTALVISRADYAKFISALVISGTCSIVGNAKFKDVDSSATVFSAGQSFTIEGENQGAPIDGITITPSGGTTNILVHM